MPGAAPRRGVGERLRRAARPRALAGLPDVVRTDVQLLRDVASGAGGHPPPASISCSAATSTHAYISRGVARRRRQHSRVFQLVCSPFRNPLGPAERRVVELTRTRPAAALLETMARLAGVQPPSVRWRYRAGPTYDNSIGILELDGRHAEAAIYRAEPGPPDRSLQPLHRRVLVDGARAATADRPEPLSG